jgi:hypothetical protein
MVTSYPRTLTMTEVMMAAETETELFEVVVHFHVRAASSEDAATLIDNLLPMPGHADDLGEVTDIFTFGATVVDA